jgi:hypothetical protein
MNNLVKISGRLKPTSQRASEHPEFTSKIAADISVLDFAEIRQRLYVKYDVSYSDTQLAIEYLRCFLDAKRARPEQLIILPQIADWAWHEFILDTSFYRAACMQVLGRFLHHVATTIRFAELSNNPTLTAE